MYADTSKVMGFSAQKCRIVAIIVGTVMLLAVGAPPAYSWTAPSLSSPSSSASLTEGKTQSFTWTGALQGDPSATEQSYFRLEIAPTSETPSGQNDEWSSITNRNITTPGASATSLKMTVPDAASASYSWRVCAMGVDDVTDGAASTIDILACSAKRTFTAVAVPSSGESDTVEVTSTTKIAGINTYATETVTTAETSPTASTQYVTKPSSDSSASFDDDVLDETENSADSLGNSDIAGDSSEDSAIGAALGSIGAITDGVASGLSWKLPGVPIPFWTLLLPLTLVPLMILWKRSASRMFDLTGDFGDSSGLLENVKDGADSADVAGRDMSTVSAYDNTAA